MVSKSEIQRNGTPMSSLCVCIEIVLCKHVLSDQRDSLAIEGSLLKFSAYNSSLYIPFQRRKAKRFDLTINHFHGLKLLHR